MTAHFDPRDFYDFGLKIARDYVSEVGYRTAIGRVYYACHLVGVRATQNKGWFTPGHSAADHSGLVRALKNRGQDALASKLSHLYRLPEHADYHVRNQISSTCELCGCPDRAGNLVYVKTWEVARIVAANILPKLEAIDPH